MAPLAVSQMPQTLDQDVAVQHADVDEATSVPSINWLDILAIGWRRKSLLALGMAAATILGAIYFSRQTPLYESAARVLIVRKRPEVVTGNQTQVSEFEDYVATHRLLIQSPLIIERATKEGRLQSLETFQQEGGDVTGSIIRKLKAEQVSNDKGMNASNVLYLAFRGPVAGECGVVIDAVLKSYQQFLDETYRDASEDTVNLITQARDVLDKDIADQERAYREFRENSPLVYYGRSTENNPLYSRLALIESQRSTLLMQQVQLESDLATIAEARHMHRPDDEILALISDLSAARHEANAERGQSTLTLQEQLFPLLQEEQRLREDCGYGPNHPSVQSVRGRIEATRRFFVVPPATHSRPDDEAEVAKGASSAELVLAHVAELQRGLDRLKANQRTLDGLFKSEHKSAQDLTRYELREEEFQRNMQRTQNLYDGIVNKMQDLSMVKDYGGVTARVIAPAGIGTQVAPNAKLIFVAWGFVGLLAGGGMVYLAEKLDTSFRTPDEIRQRLGLTVVGHIPFVEPSEKTKQRIARLGDLLSPTLCSYHERLSHAAEAFRGVRTALYFSSRGAENKVLQVTSPRPGDGKSTLASNLAVSIAQSGKRTLLIDADLRKPTLHKIFGLSKEVGLSSVIALQVEPDDAIQETPIANLSLLACGPIPPDPAELLTSPRLAELLQVVRQKYDYVIIDTAPVLAVTDPCAVAPRVDGVMLVIRVAKHGRSDALRATKILAALDVNILGVVVNGDAGKNATYGRAYKYGAYGYGGYRYSEHRDGRYGRYGDSEFRADSGAANENRDASSVADLLSPMDTHGQECGAAGNGDVAGSNGHAPARRGATDTG
ncbi:MAG TPA: polysaccharide biosynthesis tyrosine autokinase [Pirellulales bacterium]|nr:polysaccharide biosynthesis tyrosine autokinase [Pirellulales bacterium]